MGGSADPPREPLLTNRRAPPHRALSESTGWRHGLGAAATWLLLIGCAPDPGSSIDLFGVLTRAAFLPASGLAELDTSLHSAEDHHAFFLPKAVLPGDGWVPVRRGLRPVGERSLARIWTSAASDVELYLELFHDRDWEVEGTRFEAYWNRVPLGRVALERGITRARLPVPDSALAAVNDLDLRFHPPVPVIETGLPPLLVPRLGVVARGEDPPPPGSAPRAWRLESDPSRLVLRAAGDLVVPVDLPREAVELEVGFELARGAGTLAAFAIDSTGDRRRLARAAARPGRRGWLRADLGQLAGESVILGLAARLEGAGPRLEIDAARVLLEPSGSRPEAADGPAPVSRRPDVVLLLLDAARGDRFPPWEYRRELLPNIRRATEGAHAFRWAFSECPTTTCSIPHLITGVELLAGGELEGGLELSDEVTTLAEYLSAAGYRTVGYSATPNNSASRNHHQGFDEFHELWGEGNPDHGPYNLSRLAAEVIARQSADEPLYLQLHYLPPHQPYDPPPAFDRFTDPDYRGPIDPRMSLQPYSLGIETLAPADLEQLVGLYDGNLLMADDAVGRVLAALETAGRRSNTLLVVTSDHGEAFMEHGRQGHNTTLYDEMLHVPLLVDLPAGAAPVAVDTDRLASLADVVPTILGHLGLPAAPEVDGLDLLAAPPDPRRPRLLVARTSHPQWPRYAAPSCR